MAEYGTRENPIKAEGTIQEIARRVQQGKWTTLDLDALAQYALTTENTKAILGKVADVFSRHLIVSATMDGAYPVLTNIAALTEKIYRLNIEIDEVLR